MDTLRGYVRDADLFRDHAGGCFDLDPGGAAPPGRLAPGRPVNR
jgi:hypothetical protein